MCGVFLLHIRAHSGDRDLRHNDDSLPKELQGSVGEELVENAAGE